MDEDTALQTLQPRPPAMLAYPTSRDYLRLWEIAQVQSVVCIVDYDARRRLPPCRDVAQTIAHDGRVDITARGTCYTSGRSAEDLAERAAQVNLEWIVPPSAAPYPTVKGCCPSCGEAHLFVGSAGHLTCSVIGCKDPGAAGKLLRKPERKP